MAMPELQLRPIMRELVHCKRMVDQIDGRLHLDALVREHAAILARDIDGADVCDLRKRAFVQWYASGALAADCRLQPHRPWTCQLFPDAVVDQEHPANRDAREWMLAERVALRSAVSLAADLGELDAALRLCVMQWWLYESQKYADDLVATHQAGIDAASYLGKPLIKALLLVQKGYAECTRGRFANAVVALTAAGDLARAEQSLDLEATALEGAGLARFEQGDLVAAADLLENNLRLARQVGDPRRIALACLHGAKPAQPDHALELLAEARSGFRALAHPEKGDFADAVTHLEQALASMTELARDHDRAQILDVLGDVHAGTDVNASNRCYELAAQLFEEGGHVVAAASSKSRIVRVQ